MVTSTRHLVPLVCGIQSYEWGKEGRKSTVASLAGDGAAGDGWKVEDGKPYAELWMGTHPASPSHTPSGPLSQLLTSQPALLGKVSSRYDTLPFLFKVLSIGKALSIQAHPDKELAQKLHEDKPDLYKDPNHKPEMTVALTTFEAFCGFRPLEEVKGFLRDVPELGQVVGEKAKDDFLKNPNKDSLRTLFGALMKADERSVKSGVQALVGSIKGEEPWEQIVLRLNEQFPNDVGIFCTFFLNILKLEPGQAVFLKANDPHAYLSGDIIECMASSDNVVRAGLTPKLRDVTTLLSMLTFESAPASAQRMEPKAFRGTSHTRLYDPPIDEFSLLLTDLKKGEEEAIPGLQGPSIALVTQGSGEIVVGEGEGQEKATASRGTVWFIGAGMPTRLKATDDTVIYRAFCE